MTSAVIVGDVHISDKPPGFRTEGYTEQILDKIRFVSDYAKAHNLPLVFAGDVFHIKNPVKNSHKLVQQVHEALQGVETYVVPGNHDMTGDRLDTLEKQPLGSLARMKNVSLLLGCDRNLPGIAGIPYLPEFDNGDWVPVLDSWVDRTIAVFPDLVITHAPIFPPGQAPGVYASIDPEVWADRMKIAEIKATYYGHIHECHGTYEVAGHTFCNQGALSRGSLHESSVNHHPAVTLWDGVGFTRIEVPHLPSEEVFDFDRAAKIVERKASSSEFTAAVGAVKLPTLTDDNLSAILRSKHHDPFVIEKAEECLEEV